MINKENFSVPLRFIGFFGLFSAIAIQSSTTLGSFIEIKHTPYIIFISFLLISLGLFFSIKSSKEKPSLLTYIAFAVSLIIAIAMANSFLQTSLML